jgi:surface antigen/peptidoglycan hydrolase CwlO-like protein
MQHKKIRYSQFSLRVRVILMLVGSLILTSASFTASRMALAATATCSSITDCDNQIQSSTSAVQNLQNEAVSYQDALSRLNSSIGSLQDQIADSQAQQASLQTQIIQKQAEVDQQRQYLASDLQSMYVDDQMSTLEMLATSKNLSDYVDKQEYQSVIQNSLQNTITQITALQNQLNTQKTQVDNLIADQKTQQAQLVSSQQQQSSLLSYNQGQQVAYNSQTAANETRLNALIIAQRSANNSSAGGYYFLRFPGKIAPHNPNANDYPYANSGFSMSTAPGCNDGDGPDPWGYCTRQCVSYVAWEVQHSGRTAPKYYGDAKNWVAAARRNDIPIYATPEVGDVAISTSGEWGHAMYVEAVSGNKIYVSQYNQQLTGQYSTQWRTYQ